MMTKFEKETLSKLILMYIDEIERNGVSFDGAPAKPEKVAEMINGLQIAHFAIVNGDMVKGA